MATDPHPHPLRSRRKTLQRQRTRMKPAAMAIPKEGYFEAHIGESLGSHLSRDRPQITASPLSRKSFPAREQIIRAMARKLKTRLPARPMLS